jgi:hypothetical protein
MGFRIETLTAYVAVDPKDGDEGIIGHALSEGTMMPLIGADAKRIEDLRPYAEQVAAATGQQIKLVRFSVREELATLNPPS